MEGVYLQGQAGCGKTHLAAAAIWSASSGSLFVASTELLDDIRVGYEAPAAVSTSAPSRRRFWPSTTSVPRP